MTNEYINIAVSKTAGSYNLNSAYREKTFLVATDGHRLHYKSGLPNVEKGYRMDGDDAEFPCWEKVLPANTSLVCVLKVPKKLHKKLLSACKLSNDSDYECFVERVGYDLVITTVEDGWGLTLTVKLPLIQALGEFKVKVNLKYFLEALIPDQEGSISINTDGNRVSCLCIDHEALNLHAVVMPMRY